MSALHSSESAEWYTPSWIVRGAELALGGRIDFDPASSSVANQTINAAVYLTAADQAETAEWPTFRRGFCNPPSGGNGRLPRAFYARCVEAVMLAPEVASLVYVAFSPNQLRTTQNCPAGIPGLANWPLALPLKRPRFGRPRPSGDGSGHEVYTPKSPPSDSVIACITFQRAVVDRFMRAFGEHGDVVVPHTWKPGGAR